MTAKISDHVLEHIRLGLSLLIIVLVQLADEAVRSKITVDDTKEKILISFRNFFRASKGSDTRIP